MLKCNARRSKGRQNLAKIVQSQRVGDLDMIVRSKYVWHLITHVIDSLVFKNDDVIQNGNNEMR